ncbi:MAG TPA: N-acetylmuramoyl-L-alanine amidase [Terriglobales bacterium]
MMPNKFLRRNLTLPIRVRHLYKFRLPAIFAIVIGCVLFLVGDPSDQNVVSVYSPVANYSLPITPRDGRDYVGLLETLEPFGTISSRVDGQNWRLRFNGVEGIFPNGASLVRVHGRDTTLPARFLMENGRGLVPVDSLGNLLQAFLGVPVVFHATARRLFIHENGTTYTAQLAGGTPAKLVLNFSSPVNPKIATEPGKLRMTFNRDPVVASGPPSVTFNAAPISSAIFAESNGAAEITISGSAPLLASFGNDGRTITIAPAPSSASPAQTITASSPATPQASPAPVAAPPNSTTPMPSPQAPAPVPVFAVIDASHGGTETGATFSSTLLEKDVNLALARQLRQEFQSKGFSTMLLRDGDVLLSTDQRAINTNAARPALYINIHAASDGKGTRVYTAMLSSAVPDNGLFVAWDNAQAKSLTSSQAVAASIAAELGKSVPTRNAVAALRPLGNILAPAIAIEIAPRNGDVADLTAGDYQQQVASAIVVGIAAVRDKLEAAR